MKNLPLDKDVLMDCKSILRYLSTYPEVLEQMEINSLMKPEEIQQHYKDWKLLVSQYKGLEKDFYQEYWLPIESDNFQFFIDLSRPDYPIIETIYVMGGKGEEEYISSNLFESATQFLLLIEDREALATYFEKHLMLKYFNYVDDFDLEDNPFGNI